METTIQDLDSSSKQRVLSSPVVKEIMQLHRSGRWSTFYSQLPRLSYRGPPGPISHQRPSQLIGDWDLLVLRPEYQTPTHVTPLIDSLSRGLFHEHMYVVGAPPKFPSRTFLKKQESERRSFLLSLLARCTAVDGNKLFWPMSGRIYDNFWSAVRINDEHFKVS